MVWGDGNGFRGTGAFADAWGEGYEKTEELAATEARRHTEHAIIRLWLLSMSNKQDGGLGWCFPMCPDCTNTAIRTRVRLAPGSNPDPDPKRGSIISLHRWESAGTLWDHNDAIKDTGVIQWKPTVLCSLLLPPHTLHRSMMSIGLIWHRGVAVY